MLVLEPVLGIPVKLQPINIKFGWAATDHTIRDLFMYASQT